MAEPFDPLGRQINVAGRSARALLDAVLADAGTTFSGWIVLAVLDDRGPSIQKDLARELGMMGASVVERIDQLEAAGYVVRTHVPEDRRASLITLTDEGRAVLSRLSGAMRATEQALTEGLSARDIATTRRVLAHVEAKARVLRSAR